MSRLIERVIIDNWESLIQDLQDEVITDCRSILTDDEYDNIRNEDNDRIKLECFLKTVAKKSDTDFELFIESLKDYYSWLYKKLNSSVDFLKKNDPLYQVKTLGGIPNLPQRLVERTNLLQNLKTDLKKLKKGQYVVIHGMLGSGKTTLAATALNDADLIKNSFKGMVYWISVGKVGEEDLGYLQQQLNERFPHPIKELPASPHLATIQLTKMVLQHGLSECLIVLDDVKDKAVVNCFAIGTKCLVITEDKDVVGTNLESTFSCIKVDEGFSCEETLQLFSKSVNLKVKDLPEQASTIHSYIKGHPLTASLIASQLENYRDSVLNDDKRWDHYLEMLSNKKLRRRSMDYFQIFYNAIQDSVESLGTELGHLFHLLAVFVEDVNIKPEVLGTLWNLDKYEAENIMIGFVKKSLAVMKWNELQNSYVYGVHDLVSNYLKKHLSANEEMALHQNLILNYKKKCEGVWSQLPKSDNYIFYYIGYHLRKAGFNDLFQNFYFDLLFLEAKLQVCGPADLIQDFKTYKELITNQDDELQIRAEELYNFIEYNGASIHQGIDIIQAALQQPPSSSVHIAAVQLAKSKMSKQIYLHSLPLGQVESAILPGTLETKEKISIVCFGSSINEIIIASGKKLKLYNIRAKAVLKEFKGHKGDIRNLDISPCKSLLLSTSLDNTIRIWSLENCESPSGERSPSPRERQLDYLHLFNSNHVNGIDTDNAKQVLRHQSPLLWGVFSKGNPIHIASLESQGTINVWFKNEKKWSKRFSDSCFTLLDFTDNDNFIAVADKNDYVTLYFSGSGLLYRRIQYKNLISLRSLSGTLGGSLVVATKDRLIVHSHVSEKETYAISLPDHSFIKELHSVGSYITVTTESGELYVLHSLNGSLINHYPNMTRRAVSVCLCDKAILSGYSDGSVDLHSLDGFPSSLTSVKWKFGNEPVLVKMDHSQDVEVVIGWKKYDIAKRNPRIKMIDVTSDGKVIVMVCEGGNVIYQNLDEDYKEVILESQIDPFKLFLLESDSNKFVIVFYENKEALLWNEKENTAVKLNDKRSFGCSFANLFKLESKLCIMTASPLTFWTLDGEPVESKLFGCYNHIDAYCISPDLHTLVYVAANQTWLVETLSETNLDLVAAKLVMYSPSGEIIAFLIEREKSSFLTVLDCISKKQVTVKEIKEEISCMAVSNSGHVCIGGQNSLSIYTAEGLYSKIILETSSIIAQPNGEDKFAVADNSGIVHIVYLDIINGED